MNYTLAKQLKDAGFLFKKHPFPNRHNEHLEYGLIAFPDETGLYLMPTLIELIEACGEAFGGLIRRKTGDWNATTPVLEIVDEYRNPLMDADGSTPEEAVANLWLALNEK